ncbi:MAG: GntR family transcriptional regulator [Lachnospiraceae bacterium]|nr:GntR family transcriptional regulator [Lachnospiraceae bacterium]
MTWEMSSDRPIYSQLYDKILVRIVCGIYRAGTCLPSVRDLAAEAGVNPNAMQQALTELERSRLIITNRNNGRIVTEDMQLINNARYGLALKQINNFLVNMRELGYTDQDTMTLVNNTIHK